MRVRALVLAAALLAAAPLVPAQADGVPDVLYVSGTGYQAPGRPCPGTGCRLEMTLTAVVAGPHPGGYACWFRAADDGASGTADIRCFDLFEGWVGYRTTADRVLEVAGQVRGRDGLPTGTGPGMTLAMQGTLRLCPATC